MVATIIFVHGTGVRKNSYDATFKFVDEALANALGDAFLLYPCFWGEECGCELFLGGASIPDFDSLRSAIGDEPDEGEYERGLWSMLYDDPETELCLLAESADEDVPPGEAAGIELLTTFIALWPKLPGLGSADAARLKNLLARARLLDHFDDAFVQLSQSQAVAAALEAAQPPFGSYRRALARALVARALRICWECQELDEGVVLFHGRVRDEIVDLIVGALGGLEAGMFGPAALRGKRLVARAATAWFRGRRSRFSEIGAPVGADVLAYQARPGPIRNFIRRTVARRASERGGKTFLLAHSLGGIAGFEMLVEAPLADVGGLITVGSQVAFLHELDALGSLSLPRDDAGRRTGAAARLPDHFTYPWLNIYDPSDFLSYRAEPVFGSATVTDRRVDGRQPFPESHSAYWSNPDVWEAIAAFVRSHG